jgi:hypothetical protein
VFSKLVSQAGLISKSRKMAGRKLAIETRLGLIFLPGIFLLPRFAFRVFTNVLWL